MPFRSLVRSSCRAFAACILALPLAAQVPQTPVVVQEHAVPAAASARRTSAVTIDGKLDEAAWAAATPITQFRQSRPDEGAAATLATEIRILYDDDALYVAARMSEPMG